MTYIPVAWALLTAGMLLVAGAVLGLEALWGRWRCWTGRHDWRLRRGVAHPLLGRKWECARCRRQGGWSKISFK